MFELDQMRAVAAIRLFLLTRNSGHWRNPRMIPRTRERPDDQSILLAIFPRKLAGNIAFPQPRLTRVYGEKRGV
jgi:hypothetical protein